MSNEGNKPPVGPWETGGKDFTQEIRLDGRSDIGWGTVNTSNQRLYGAINFLPYKLTGNDPSYDYYAFVGSMTHGVTTSQNNWLSVGYYATEMDLVVTCLTESSTVYDHGPDSTVGTNNTSFTIGTGLQGGFKGDEPTGTAGFNASWGVSFASPDVSFSASRLGNRVTWRCKLPCISFKSPGIPADPFPASAAGYSWKPALIVKVPKGKPPILEISVRIQWNFDYTRGITNDVKSWVQVFTYNYQGVPSIKDGALLKGSRPAIYVMESGKRRLIPSPAIFEAKGYKWEDVIIIPNNELENLPLGTPLSIVLAYQEKGTLLHISGTTSDGKLWHSIRFSSGSWSSFGDVEGQTGDSGFITNVALQGIGDVIHLCAVNNSGSLWHTIRRADGSWFPFGDVKGQAGNSGNFVHVSVAEVGGELHVCGVTDNGHLWHTIRHANSWSPFGDVEGPAGDRGKFINVSCAEVGGEFHVCGVTNDGHLWHTIRHANSWEPFGDVEGPAGDRGKFINVSCAEVGGELHVCGVTDDGHLWHTIRHTNSWEPFGDVEGPAGDRGKFINVSCAEVGGELHVSGVTDDGNLWHTIRHTNSWSPFGNVEGPAGDRGYFKAVSLAGLFIA